MGALITKVWNRFYSLEEMKILMVGLDAAGKTTILYKVKMNESVNTIPTVGFNVEEVTYKNVSFSVWDLGGQDKIRSLWQYYYENTSAIIFVVDSNDEDRLELAKEELWKLAREESLKDCIYLVYANKQDLPSAVSVPEVA